MCARFAITTPVDAVARAFSAEPPTDPFGPRYNLAPTEPAPVVLREPSGRRVVRLHRFGLVPPWARDPRIGARLLNARAETLASRPSFRGAARARRCIVPATAFYEWEGPRGRRLPVLFRRRDGGLLALAGIWERWTPPSGGPALGSFAIVTVPANALVGRLHDRMPALLAPEEVDRWLEPGPPPLDLLRPAPDELLESLPLAPVVNRPGAEGPACWTPRGM